MKCPNKNTREAKAILARFGEDGLYSIFAKNKEELPTTMRELANLTKSKQFERQATYIEKVNAAIRKQLDKMGIGVGTLEQ